MDTEMSYHVHGFDPDNDYGVKYDANGNILGMVSHGFKVGNPTGYIDALRYTYQANSNKLLKVSDDYSDPNTRMGDFKDGTNSGNDYAYDANGNLVKDLNKDIESYTGANGIEYNHLNQPTKITVKASGSANKGTIEYVYDASGNKLKKVTTEGSKVTTTLYLFGTYINDTLQFLPHEEGRIRPDTANASFVYDYFLKDHLGNVRMVLTEEQKVDAYPVASLEPVNNKYDLNDPNNYIPFYGNTDYLADPYWAFPITEIPNYPTDNYTPTNQYVTRLNGVGAKLGTNMTLKVMAGDQVNIRVSSYYEDEGPVDEPWDMINILIQALNSGLGNVAGSKATSTQLTNNNTLNSAAHSFSDNRPYDEEKPKAFLNWIFFDEQFKYVSSGSGADQVGAEGVLKAHTINGIEVAKNGYLYIYVSNESPRNVYFDNMQVTHIRGPILEETHYYPFGSKLAGISSKAAGSIRNRYQFNYGTELSNEEFSDGSGLEWYETAHRSYDPQIGRFHQVDPLGELTMNFSLYSFAYNNPILFNDPLGLTPNEFNGPQNITGWVKRPNGEVYFDPNVHNQEDLDPKSGLTYLGEEIKITDDNGNVVGFGNDQGGISYNTNLENVTVTASAKKKRNGGFWSGALDIVQTGIDVVGLIPVVGEIADGANALIYTARGDYTSAALSAAAMIPIAGWGATGGKFVNKALKFTKDQQALIEIAKTAKKTGGVTEAEAKILKEWSDEYNIPFRGPEAHPNRPFNLPHIHVGPVDHIKIK